MEQTYQYLLSLECNHRYFKDGRFKPLQITLDDETIRLCKNLGIIFKPFSGGMHFLALNPELLRGATANTTIRLFLECNDPYYINYSELGNYRPSDTVLYFNNKALISNEDSTTLQLHSEDYVSHNDICKLSSGKIILEKPDGSNTYHFKDIFENDVSENVRFLRKLENDTKVEYSISNLQAGIIKVLVAEEEIERLYYYPKSVWKKPIGIVELFVSELSEQYEQKGKQVYTLNFDTKRTIWKYFLVDTVYQNFEKLHIVKGKKERIFNPPIEEEVAGSKALMFESKEALPLLEYSDTPLRLVNGDEVTPTNVLNPLPSASPEQLFKNDENNNESVYSHIYI